MELGLKVINVRAEIQKLFHYGVPVLFSTLCSENLADSVHQDIPVLQNKFHFSNDNVYRLFPECLSALQRRCVVWVDWFEFLGLTWNEHISVQRLFYVNGLK